MVSKAKSDDIGDKPGTQWTPEELVAVIQYYFQGADGTEPSSRAWKKAKKIMRGIYPATSDAQIQVAVGKAKMDITKYYKSYEPNKYNGHKDTPLDNWVWTIIARNAVKEAHRLAKDWSINDNNGKYASELDKCLIGNSLRRKLEKKKIRLSADASVIPRERGCEWSIHGSEPLVYLRRYCTYVFDHKRYEHKIQIYQDWAHEELMDPEQLDRRIGKLQKKVSWAKLTELLTACISRLPEKERKVLEFFLEGKNFAEIGAVMHISEINARVTKHRAIQEILRLLVEDDELHKALQQLVDQEWDNSQEDACLLSTRAIEMILDLLKNDQTEVFKAYLQELLNNYKDGVNASAEDTCVGEDKEDEEDKGN